MGMLKASRMTGPGSTLGLGLYSNFYSKMAAVEASTPDTPCLRAPYTLQHLQPLQPLQLYSISTVYSLYTTPLAYPQIQSGRHSSVYSGERSVQFCLWYTEGFRHCCRRPSKRRPTENSSSKSFHLHSNTKCVRKGTKASKHPGPTDVDVDGPGEAGPCQISSEIKLLIKPRVRYVVRGYTLPPTSAAGAAERPGRPSTVGSKWLSR